MMSGEKDKVPPKLISGTHLIADGAIAIDPPTHGTQLNVCVTHDNVVETPVVEKEKRTIKLTQKALLDKLEKLQRNRKSKLKKASDLKGTIKDIMQDGENKRNVYSMLEKHNALCDEAEEAHNYLLELLPPDEKEKHEIWFEAKMLSVNELNDEVNKWLSNTDVLRAAGIVENEGGDDDESEINPSDSISNVEEKSGKKSSRKSDTSSKTSKSSGSSTSSARIQAEAERAALMARVAALEEKHALEEEAELVKRRLEEEAELLRRRQEKLELQTEMAASAAKLAVLACSEKAPSRTQSNGKESYLKRGARPKSTIFVTRNPPMDSHSRKPPPPIQQQPSIQLQPQQPSSVQQHAYRNATFNPPPMRSQYQPLNSQQQPSSMQQPQPHAYRNAIQDNRQDNQITTTLVQDGKT